LVVLSVENTFGSVYNSRSPSHGKTTENSSSLLRRPCGYSSVVGLVVGLDVVGLVVGLEVPEVVGLVVGLQVMEPPDPDPDPQIAYDGFW
jgi:hypothetical protein